ncbi:MAG: sporulation protein YabP [Oscillospiraceae bacterium]|nr:sporulation protein YabP [Oscillospiraceae bacterium]MBQ6845770.1 sporulation protein YabP [Oscillospiraceae bacterium]MBQ7119231.1 sporulation protein YabP [Oscillospiraceae bacterium]
MQFEDKSVSKDVPQNIIIENRFRMSISGVSDVENFDESIVQLSTNRGLLTVKGSGLHIERLNLETGELAVEGTIDGLEYSELIAGGSFWSRLFK